MWHPDEGSLHAWIEGQLPADEAQRVASHVEHCDECQRAVTEARGVIAGASRVVGFLDDAVGAGTANGNGDAQGQLRTATTATRARAADHRRRLRAEAHYGTSRRSVS